MFHPTRGGTRGGAAEFSWDHVRQDKDRENYLGHSVLAPTGRWQSNKDVNWYNRDNTAQAGQPAGGDAAAAAEARRQELLAIKQREEEEINRRLGRKPGVGTKAAVPASDTPRVGDALLYGSRADMPAGNSGRGTGANTAPLDGAKQRWYANGKADHSVEALEAGVSQEERRAARKLAKMEVREQRREERRKRKEERRAVRGTERREHSLSESESGENDRRHRRHGHRGRSRSRSPVSRHRHHDEDHRREEDFRRRRRSREGPDRSPDYRRSERGARHEDEARERRARYETQERLPSKNSQRAAHDRRRDHRRDEPGQDDWRGQED